MANRVIDLVGKRFGKLKAKMNMDGHEYLALCRRVSEHWNSREMEERESA